MGWPPAPSSSLGLLHLFHSQASCSFSIIGPHASFQSTGLLLLLHPWDFCISLLLFLHSLACSFSISAHLFLLHIRLPAPTLSLGLMLLRCISHLLLLLRLTPPAPSPSHTSCSFYNSWVSCYLSAFRPRYLSSSVSHSSQRT
jgi:hypothetical protein